MKPEWTERMHDQARVEMGYCVQDPASNWCTAHEALKFPGEEACRTMRTAYDVAELAGEKMGDLIADGIRALGHTRHCSKNDESPSFPDMPCTCIVGEAINVAGGGTDE